MGQIPEHWEVVGALKRIASVAYGVGGEIDKMNSSGTKTISLPHLLIDGRLILEGIPLTEMTSAEKARFLLKPGDILFNWLNGSSDHVGKTVVFRENGEWTHVSFLLRIRLSAEDSPKYLHFGPGSC